MPLTDDNVKDYKVVDLSDTPEEEIVIETFDDIKTDPNIMSEFDDAQQKLIENLIEFYLGNLIENIKIILMENLL